MMTRFIDQIKYIALRRVTGSHYFIRNDELRELLDQGISRLRQSGEGQTKRNTVPVADVRRMVTDLMDELLRQSEANTLRSLRIPYPQQVLAEPHVRHPGSRTGDGNSGHGLGVTIQDAGGNATHAYGPFLIIDRIAPLANCLQFLA